MGRAPRTIIQGHFAAVRDGVRRVAPLSVHRVSAGRHEMNPSRSRRGRRLPQAFSPPLTSESRREPACPRGLTRDRFVRTRLRSSASPSISAGGRLSERVSAPAFGLRSGLHVRGSPGSDWRFRAGAVVEVVSGYLREREVPGVRPWNDRPSQYLYRPMTGRSAGACARFASRPLATVRPTGRARVKTGVTDLP